MNVFSKYSHIILSTIICILVIYLPFYDTQKLFKSYITEKTFLFAAVTGVLMLVQTLIILFGSGKVKSIRLTWLDLALFAFVGYVSLNRLLVSEMGGITLKYYQLVILCIFYIILRCIPSKYYQYFMYSLLVSGIIQAVYGNLQLYNIYPSNHHLFNITGSFFNPGPYSGYLSIIFPIALVLYLKNRKVPVDFQDHIKIIVKNILRPGFFSVKALKTAPARFKNGVIKYGATLNRPETIAIVKQCFQKYLSLAAIIAILLVIPATRSRASWLAIIISSAYIGINEFSIHRRLLCYFNSKARKVLAGFGMTILVGVLLAGFYYFKKDSADGRLLIWKVSAGMIKDKPVFGFGFEKFQADYMHYQAEYFMKDPDNLESYVADDIIYPFNEFVKTLVETGLTGFLLLCFIIFLVFYSTKRDKPDVYASATRGGILGISVFSFFSYSSEILPVLISLVMVLAIFSEKQEPVSIKMISYRWNDKRTVPIIRILLTCMIIALAAFMYLPAKNLYKAYFSWDEGNQIYRMGAYQESSGEF
jgi:O-antigen polymerase